MYKNVMYKKIFQMSDREFDYEFSDIDAENSEHSDDRSSEQESDY